MCHARGANPIPAEKEAPQPLSVILDAENPDYVQPWWGQTMPGTGMIHLDWRRWIEKGLVDEFWVQLCRTESQKKTLDLLLGTCAGTPIKVTLRTPSPFDSQLKTTAATVTPLAEDPHVLVRRKALKALKALADPQSAATIERSLSDSESSVRIAAADALAEINGSETPERIIEALEQNCGFQFNTACVQECCRRLPFTRKPYYA
jgi:hypothetical protein